MALSNSGSSGGHHHGVSLPGTSISDSSSDSTPEHDPTPDHSDSGSSSPDVSYFASHGIAAGPKDDFNSLFNRLAIKEGWSKTQRKKRRHEAIAGEIDAIYGTDTTKLDRWQELCRDVKIEPVPGSISKCRKALSGVYVNLVNLINHRRDRSVDVILFPNYQAFRTWTLGGKKFGERIFPKRLAKKEGFIKALLKELHLSERCS